MGVNFKHISFNPNELGGLFAMSPLSRLCEQYEKDDWMLSHVIPHTQWESVAVFVRGAESDE